MPDPMIEIAKIIDSQIESRLAKFKKDIQKYVDNRRIGAEQIKPGAIIQPKLSTGIKQTITNAQTDIEDAKDRLDSAEGRLTDAEGNISAVQSTASQLTSDMTNAQGDISTLVQRADGFNTAVSNINGDISTIQQNADSLALVVGGKLDADDPASGIVTSGLSITQDGTLISIPPTGSFGIEINGEEEGQVAMYLNKDGTYIPDFSSPTVAPACLLKGDYIVGSGKNFSSLSNAFSEISNRQLTGDITLKVVDWDTGGTLQGVGGGYAVTITGVNLFEKTYAPARTYDAIGGVNGYGLAYAELTVANQYAYAVWNIGRIGDLNAAGKTIHFGAWGVEKSSADIQPMLTLWKLDVNKWPSVWLGSVSESTSYLMSDAVVPSDASPDEYLGILLYPDFRESAVSGARASWGNVYAELGSANKNNTGADMPVVCGIEIKDCSAQINVSRLALGETLRIRNSRVHISRSLINGSAPGVHAELAQVSMRACTGANVQAVKSVCSQVYVTEGAPSGTYDGWLIDTSTASISTDTPTAQTTKTATITASSTGTYQSGAWISADRAIRQGYTNSSGTAKGGIWFSLSSIPANATVTNMTLTLHRVTGFGQDSAVNVVAYGTASAARNGSPALTSDAYNLGSIGWGKTKTFTLPSELVTGFANGTYKGIVLHPGDGAVLSGKSYSANYAKFGGTDGDNPPRLVVTYTV